MQFKEEIHREAADRAMAMLERFERGVDIRLTQFEEAFGVPRSDHALFRYLLRKLEKRLWREKRIRMCSVCPGSQRMLTPQENLTIYHPKQAKRRYRNAGKTLRTLVATNPAELPLHERKKLDFAMQGMRHERRDIVRSKNLAKKSEVNPIRRPAAAAAAHTG